MFLLYFYKVSQINFFNLHFLLKIINNMLVLYFMRLWAEGFFIMLYITRILIKNSFCNYIFSFEKLRDLICRSVYQITDNLLFFISK